MKSICFVLVVSALFVPAVSGQTNISNVSHQVSFDDAFTFTSPVLYPQSIAAADVNHDGIADLAVVGEESPGVCTTTAWQSGTWDCSGIAGDAPEQIIFADVNLDGNPDVVGTDADLPIVTVGYGNGKGQFHSGVGLRTKAGYATQQAAVADLNGDGIPDIVTTFLDPGYGAGGLAIFLGQGGGKLAQVRRMSSGGNVPFSVAVGDLNHDGIPDLVVANFGTESNGDYGNIAVFLGKKEGGYVSPVAYVGLHDPEQAILADFDGDGNLDIAAIALGKREIYVSLGRGDGLFSKPLLHHIEEGPGCIATADFNGDGVLDVAVCIGTEQIGGVGIMLGNGDGTFQQQVNFQVGLNPQEIAIGDFNGDGKPDIATIDGGDSTISILLNNTPASNAPKQPGH